MCKSVIRLLFVFQDGTLVQAFVAEVLGQIVGISVIRNEMVNLFVYFFFLFPFKMSALSLHSVMPASLIFVLQ